MDHTTQGMYAEGTFRANTPLEKAAAAGALGSSLNRVPADPLDSLDQQLRSAAERISRARARLGVKIDRIIGSQPEDPYQVEGEPYCLAAWVEVLLREVELLERTLERL